MLSENEKFIHVIKDWIRNKNFKNVKFEFSEKKLEKGIVCKASLMHKKNNSNLVLRYHSDIGQLELSIGNIYLDIEDFSYEYFTEILNSIANAKIVEKNYYLKGNLINTKGKIPLESYDDIYYQRGSIFYPLLKKLKFIEKIHENYIPWN